MKKKLKNTEKYFLQKPFSVLDIILFVITAVSLFFAWFINGGGPVGLPVFIVSLFALILSRSARVKDSEIDAEIERIKKSSGLELGDRDHIATFDLKSAPIIKGKDGKFRTKQFVISIFENQSSATRITVYRLDLVDGVTTSEEYLLSPEDSLSLSEITIETRNGSKKQIELCCDRFEAPIPITMSDVNSEEIIKKIGAL